MTTLFRKELLNLLFILSLFFLPVLTQPVFCEVFSIKTNTLYTFSVPERFLHQQGYFDGIMVSSGFSPRCSFDSIAIRNTTDQPVTIDGIVLNNTPMGFNNRVLKENYGVAGTVSLPQMLQLFWDNYRLTHHAQSNVGGNGSPTTLWNCFGYGLCGWQNTAFNQLLSECGVHIRQVPIMGHVLFEYYIDGAWRLIDFNQKAYYLTVHGDVASYEDVRTDPYLVFQQKTYGPLSPRLQDYGAAVILQGTDNSKVSLLSWKFLNKVKNHVQYRIRRLKRLFRKMLLNIAAKFSENNTNHPPQKMAETLRLAPEDEIVFLSRQDTTSCTDYTEDLWERANVFLKQGYLSRSCNDTISTVLIDEVSLPFLVTDYHVSFIAQGKAVLESILYFNNRKIPFFSKTNTDSSVTFSASRTLSVPSHTVKMKLYCRSLDTTSSCIYGLKIRTDFFYNIRTIHSVLPSSELFVRSRDTSFLSVRIGMNEQYNNYVVRKKVKAGVFLKDGRVHISISPLFRAKLFEYFLSKNSTDYPVSPAYYFIDSTGYKRISPECLPPGKLKLHYRAMSTDGYWSYWQTADDTIPIGKNKTDTTPFRIQRKMNELVGYWTVPADSAKYTLVLCNNIFSAIRPGTPFITKAENIRWATLTEKAPSEYRSITLNSDTALTLPRWAAYYRVWRNGIAKTSLCRTTPKGESGRTSRVRGKTWRLHYKMLEWPVEEYQWVEQVE